MKTQLLALMGLSVLLLSCLNNVEDLTGEIQTNVSFSSEVQPILNSRCVSCHSSSVRNGNLDLSSYAGLMNSTGSRYGDDIVVDGNADASGLIDAIEPDPDSGIDRMPQGGPYLSGTQIELIKAWINEGAQNN
jgi:mono/diheme cytochrome c family protein